jgi:hypothetical protein
MRKYTVIVMEIKFRTKKDRDRVCKGYRVLTKFVLEYQYISFGWETCKFNFTNIEFHKLAHHPHVKSISCSSRLPSSGKLKAG